MNFWDTILRKDKITAQIDKKLKKTQKGLYPSTEQQEKLKVYLGEIYKDTINYSVEDIIKRKIYLQTKLDNENAITGTIGLTCITWLVIEGLKSLFLLIFTGEIDEQYFNATMITPIFAFIFCWPISYFLGRVDRKYRKYNLIDFELKIIDSILEQYFDYSKTIGDITNSHASTSLLTPSTDDPLSLFNEKT